MSAFNPTRLGQEPRPIHYNCIPTHSYPSHFSFDPLLLPRGSTEPVSHSVLHTIRCQEPNVHTIYAQEAFLTSIPRCLAHSTRRQEPTVPTNSIQEVTHTCSFHTISSSAVTVNDIAIPTISNRNQTARNKSRLKRDTQRKHTLETYLSYKQYFSERESRRLPAARLALGPSSSPVALTARAAFALRKDKQHTNNTTVAFYPKQQLIIRFHRCVLLYNVFIGSLIIYVIFIGSCLS